MADPPRSPPNDTATLFNAPETEHNNSNDIREVGGTVGLVENEAVEVSESAACTLETPTARIPETPLVPEVEIDPTLPQSINLSNMHNL